MQSIASRTATKKHPDIWWERRGSPKYIDTTQTLSAHIDIPLNDSRQTPSSRNGQLSIHKKEERNKIEDQKLKNKNKQEFQMKSALQIPQIGMIKKKDTEEYSP